MAHDFTGTTVGDLETLQPNQNTMVLTETSPNVYESLGMGGVSTGISVGSFFWFCGASIPAFALECDGSAISRTTYAALFNIIGTAFGVGNGTTTFNLPDLTTANRFVRAADGSTLEVGDTQADGAPNITGSLGTSTTGLGIFANNTGAFSALSTNENRVSSTGANPVPSVVDFSAAASDATYGAASEVRPVNIALVPCIAWREFQTGSINSYPLMEDTIANDDYVFMFDVSAGINKKVLMSDLKTWITT